MMRYLACLFSLFALLVTAAFANTEKVIFIAPAALTLPHTGPDLRSLGLSTISSQNTTLQTALSVAFPTKEQPRGVDSWYFLNDLQQGQRYEIRICWAATQPTEFWLTVYGISHVFDTPSLIQSLSAFTEKNIEQSGEGFSQQGEDLIGSLLFLRVQAVADYFTTNKSLMQRPPLVHADIILDRYLLNVFPESLVPTAGYLMVLAILAFFVSGQIWEFLRYPSRRKQHQD